MGTAPKARTLDAAHVSAGYNRVQNIQPVDIARVKRVVTLAMVLSRYGILNQLNRSGSQLTGCATSAAMVARPRSRAAGVKRRSPDKTSTRA